MNITSEKRFEILAHLVAGLAASGHYTETLNGEDGPVILKTLEDPEERKEERYEIIQDAEQLYERLEWIVEKYEPDTESGNS